MCPPNRERSPHDALGSMQTTLHVQYCKYGPRPFCLICDEDIYSEIKVRHQIRGRRTAPLMIPQALLVYIQEGNNKDVVMALV